MDIETLNLGAAVYWSMARETYVVEATARTDTHELERQLAETDARVRRVSDDELDVTEPTTTSLKPGDVVVDTDGPTPSPEKNTVVVAEVLDERIDEHMIDTDTGEISVYDYNDGLYPASDPVVRAFYKFLNPEQIYSFPASRLREV